MITFLDTGILGILTSPSDRQEVRDCVNWLYQLIARGVYFISSDICDYEVRRSLILESFKYNKEESIKELDKLQEIVDFFPVSTNAMRSWPDPRLFEKVGDLNLNKNSSL